ncbi:Uncharacterised protein [Mycobacteroides abscessus subsp. bolletii]|nr:Uncharacterised protein [Mycobacteroides abscessus subsp. bolletii]
MSGGFRVRGYFPGQVTSAEEDCVSAVLTVPAGGAQR